MSKNHGASPQYHETPTNNMAQSNSKYLHSSRALEPETQHRYVLDFETLTFVEAKRPEADSYRRGESSINFSRKEIATKKPFSGAITPLHIPTKPENSAQHIASTFTINHFLRLSPYLTLPPLQNKERIATSTIDGGSFLRLTPYPTPKPQNFVELQYPDSELDGSATLFLHERVEPPDPTMDNPVFQLPREQFEYGNATEMDGLAPLFPHECLEMPEEVGMLNGSVPLPAHGIGPRRTPHWTPRPQNLVHNVAGPSMEPEARGKGKGKTPVEQKPEPKGVVRSVKLKGDLDLDLGWHAYSNSWYGRSMRSYAWYG
ncbi:hypothetical protein CC78DRAFT_578472 [Lojkania enalia]|uniref:Uncharacterized protein n=1 Tax=Lojkania enalia TaxID=147567 RepID=A0A9P4KED4_9PLEO|nr:hypothetical protein CC78DRAFT_578472 [Didymosphaeria enalia]